MPDVQRHCMQQIASALSDGLILVRLDQTITWANAAALSMHDVSSVEQLGRTIDEYHARFQVKFWSPRAETDIQTAPESASETAYRDAVIEITPLGGMRPRWVHRVRNMVFTDDAGQPDGIALVLSPISGQLLSGGQFQSSIEALPYPAIIIHRSGRHVVAANAPFTTLTGLQRQQILTRDVGQLDFLPRCLGADLTTGIADPAPACVRMNFADHPPQTTLMQTQDVVFDGQACLLATFVQIEPSWLLDAAQQDDDGALLVAARLACTATPAPMYALDGEMRITAVSDSLAAWLEYDRSDLEGRQLTDILTPSSAAYFNDHFWSSLSQHGSAQDATCEFVRKSGTPAHAHVCGQPSLDADGQVRQVVCSLSDLARYRRSEDKFNKLFALSPLPMIVRKLDDRRVLDVNEAFISATGHQPQALIGRSLDEVAMFETTAGRHRFEQDLRGKTGPENTVGGKHDIRLRTADGTMLDYQIHADLVHAFDHPCALIVLIDVTERRRDERQLFMALENVMKDSSWFSRSVIERLASIRSPTAGSRSVEIDDLTKREREVLAMISHGWSDADIASTLNLTRSTVRNHVAALYSKIDVHSRSSAIVWARERALNITCPVTAFTPALRRTPRRAAE